MTDKKKDNALYPLIPAVLRPKMMSEALSLLKEGKQIEIHNETLFDFMRYTEKSERNFRYKCYVNEFTEGWTVIKHCR